LLLASVERMEAKPERYSCSIMWNRVNHDRVRYTKLWASEADFRDRARSVEFRYLIAAMDRCCAGRSMVPPNSQ